MQNFISFLIEETPGNQSLLNTEGCDTVHCILTESWIQEHGYSARSDWNQILIYYTVLRCLIDVLRASSIMMFEVNFHFKLYVYENLSYVGSSSSHNKATRRWLWAPKTIWDFWCYNLGPCIWSDHWYGLKCHWNRELWANILHFLHNETYKCCSHSKIKSKFQKTSQESVQGMYYLDNIIIDNMLSEFG